MLNVVRLAGSGDVTRFPFSTIQPLPLSDSTGTLSTSLHTPDVTRGTYPIISTPGAVTIGVQILGLGMTCLVDRCAIVLLVSDDILSFKLWPLQDSSSSEAQCYGTRTQVKHPHNVHQLGILLDSLAKYFCFIFIYLFI